jgi:hypothetical protein
MLSSIVLSAAQAYRFKLKARILQMNFVVAGAVPVRLYCEIFRSSEADLRLRGSTGCRPLGQP